MTVLLVGILAALLAACASPTAPTLPLADTPTAAATTERTLPLLLDEATILRRPRAADCTVTSADLERARLVIEMINEQLTPARLTVDVTERRSVRSLRLSLWPVQDDLGATAQLRRIVLGPNALRFTSDQAAGWAVWEEAVRVHWGVKGLTVNGTPVVGCSPLRSHLTFKALIAVTTRPPEKKAP